MTSSIDSILVSVLQRKLKSITEQMALTLLRATRSPVLNEARDFATGIYDQEGKMLEQTEYAPLLAFAIQPACEFIIDYFQGDFSPGDVIIHNDVFTCGNQLQDMSIFKPIFYQNNLVGWAACKAHVADVGGPIPGSINPGAREIWQEGLRIPPVKIYEGGKFKKDAWNLIFANIRFEMVEEDVKAEIGCCTIGEREVIKLIDKYGTEIFRSNLVHSLDATEKMLRAEISRIPDGVYHGESYEYYDGVTDGTRMKINLTVTVKDDEIWFDYSGTDPQTEGFVNAPYTSSLSLLVMTFLMHVDPYLPHNEGVLRPLHINIPEGTILNARFPAANTFGNFLSCAHAHAIQRALANALPGKVTSGWNRLLEGVITGVDARFNRHYHDFFFISAKGGSGGSYGQDGYDYIGLVCCAGGMRAQDPEMYEIQDPHLIIKNELWEDSAGAGRWRGGFGVQSEIKLYGQKAAGVVFGDGIDPGGRGFGLFGGLEGEVNSIELEFPDGTIKLPKCKEVLASLPPGTIWRHWAGGGGGYGKPYEREVEQVLADVQNGLVSCENALRLYGVAIDPDTLTVNWEETRAIRNL